MAVGLRIKFANGTQEQYDAVNAQMGIAAGPIEDGWGVIDFWESRGHFDQFQADRLGPAIQELGDRAPQGPPDIKEFPVYNHMTG